LQRREKIKFFDVGGDLILSLSCKKIYR